MKMEDAAQRKNERGGVGTKQRAFPGGSLGPGVGGEGGSEVGVSWLNDSGSDKVCAMSSLLKMSRSGVSLVSVVACRCHVLVKCARNVARRLSVRSVSPHAQYEDKRWGFCRVRRALRLNPRVSLGVKNGLM